MTKPQWTDYLTAAKPKDVYIIFHVGDEKIVSDELDTISQFFRHDLPSVPVILGHTVFDGEYGVLIDEGRVVVDHFHGG